MKWLKPFNRFASTPIPFPKSHRLHMRKEARNCSVCWTRKSAQLDAELAYVQGMMEYQQIISNLQAAGRSDSP